MTYQRIECSKHGFNPITCKKSYRGCGKGYGCAAEAGGLGGTGGTVEKQSNACTRHNSKHHPDVGGTTVAGCQKPLGQTPVELPQH
jgi:hypothetical protein